MTCPKCNGSGTELVNVRGFVRIRDCRLCGGTGFFSTGDGDA